METTQPVRVGITVGVTSARPLHQGRRMPPGAIDQFIREAARQKIRRLADEIELQIMGGRDISRYGGAVRDCDQGVVYTAARQIVVLQDSGSNPGPLMLPLSANGKSPGCLPGDRGSIPSSGAQ